MSFSSSAILHTYPYLVTGDSTFVDFRTAKVLIAAKYSNKDVQVDESILTPDGNLSDAFLTKFPLGKAPGLCLPGSSSKNQTIGESNAAAYFLANEQLKGGESEVSRAQVLQWMNFAETDLVPAIYNWVFPIIGLMKQPENEDAALGHVVDLLKKLNTHLGLCMVVDGLMFKTICLISCICTISKYFRAMLT